MKQKPVRRFPKTSPKRAPAIPRRRGPGFQPGQSGNPAGRPGLPPSLRVKMSEGKEAFIKSILKVKALTPVEINAFIKRKDITIEEKDIAIAYKKGDWKVIEYLHNRMWGKVVQVFGGDDDGNPVTVAFDRDTRERLAAIFDSIPAGGEK